MTQLNMWLITGHHITLSRENESHSSSAKGKMKFALWEESSKLPTVGCQAGVEVFAFLWSVPWGLEGGRGRS